MIRVSMGHEEYLKMIDFLAYKSPLVSISIQDLCNVSESINAVVGDKMFYLTTKDIRIVFDPEYMRYRIYFYEPEDRNMQ